MTSVWSPSHVAAIGAAAPFEAPLITAADVRPMIEGMDLWDMWPLALSDGTPAPVLGGSLWIYLAAPRCDDPTLRHDHARMRLLHLVGGRWRDLGPVLTETLSPGSREWSGSAVLDPASGRVVLFFTAAGRAGGSGAKFEQRLFQTEGRLDITGGAPRLVGWTAPWQNVVPDGQAYVDTALAAAEPGMIKGFRDPGYVHDPADGSDYLLFTASLAGSAHRYNGAIGWARAEGPGLTAWRLLPPLVVADGLCNEMERPHVIVSGGLYYLFWSSQASVFDPSGPRGPTGLYGMVAGRMAGPWRPLNRTGLVIANPAAAPRQAYCWWVTPDLTVNSFIDNWRDENLDAFGGTAAPALRIALAGDRTRLLGLAA